MPDDLIENPVINSPYAEPTRHFVFDDQGITNKIAEGRRSSQHLVPIAAPRKRGPQLVLEDWPLQERRPNALINRIREEVGLWRAQSYPGVTAVTRSLLEHWRDPRRDRRLFFCQVEAAETAIYLIEGVTGQRGVGWLGELQAANREYSEVLRRYAFKIATGGGKTVVMAMLIAWQALNKLANTRDPRFATAFLMVAPSITIRDRLRVLLPNDPDAAYVRMDLVPRLQLEALNRATVLVVNYHHFIRRDRAEASRLTKQILAPDGETSPFMETWDEMAARICRDIPSRRRDWGIVIINDEAHHCYRRKAHDAVDEELTADERREATRDEREAAVWISGLEAIARKYGVKAVFDLSATPFFLKGSGHPEGTLFPWVVSDFALTDAIEAGIVKVPRVPVADNRGADALPTYRNLWKVIGTQLPKGRRRAGSSGDGAVGEPKLPAHLEGALQSLYSNYRKSHDAWLETGIGVPPVFIAVCNNTLVSKMVYDYIAGYERSLDNGEMVWVSGALDLFSNVADGRQLVRPNTILVDSRELETGEPLSAEFKKAAAAEIERYKDEYRRRFPSRDVEDLADADVLREVLNTVGKPGRLGEAVRCVVSVSMLTEGWDANTVTHVLGVRAFTTQLLCEQVVGRALRRFSYVADDNGMFPAEYAEVYGVPFSFIPTAATSAKPTVQVIPTTVRALDERDALAITFPRVTGYRRTATLERLTPHFTADSAMRLTTRDVATKTELDPIVGRGSIHDMDELRSRRMQEVVFVLARRLHQDHFRDAEGNERVWLFPQLLDVSRRWLDECLTCTDETFPQLLLLHQLSIRAAERISRALDQREGTAHLVAVLDPGAPTGSTRGLEFETIKAVFETRKSHISHVVLDSNWESKMAQVLEDMPEVVAYVKNDRLGFEIPYTFDGHEARYRPDFIVQFDDGHGPDDHLNLLVEVTGERRDAKQAKAATAAAIWAPAVNRLASLGRWSYVEVSDPWSGSEPIREHISARTRVAVNA